MTYEQIKNLQISNVIASTSEFQGLAKQCLSIVESSTAKDKEISMWIGGAVADMTRVGIDVAGNLSDGLVQGAIVMFVKANFGMCDIKEKDLANQRYNQICSNLSLSEKYKLKEVIEQ